MKLQDRLHIAQVQDKESNYVARLIVDVKEMLSYGCKLSPKEQELWDRLQKK